MSFIVSSAVFLRLSPGRFCVFSCEGVSLRMEGLGEGGLRALAVSVAFWPLFFASSAPCSDWGVLAVISEGGVLAGALLNGMSGWLVR